MIPFKRHVIELFEREAMKPYFCGPLSERRGVRVVEGARLESVYSGNAIAGSNPALSANENRCPVRGVFVLRT
jgi:hypothetical protein